MKQTNIFENKKTQINKCPDCRVPGDIIDEIDEELEEEQNNKIKKAQEKAEKLGHCLCDIKSRCPCAVYINIGECKCANII